MKERMDQTVKLGGSSKVSNTWWARVMLTIGEDPTNQGNTGGAAQTTEEEDTRSPEQRQTMARSMEEIPQR